MLHSQILESFEAKNITCVFFHDKSNLAIEITKDIFHDDKKIQKSAGKWSKKTFLHFLSLWPKRIWTIFTPYLCYLEGISTMWATPYGSDSAGRGKRLFYVLFFLKVELPCDLT